MHYYAFLNDDVIPSCDLIVTSLVVKLIGAWFSDSELSTCSSASYNFILNNKGNIYVKLCEINLQLIWA